MTSLFSSAEQSKSCMQLDRSNQIIAIPISHIYGSRLSLELLLRLLSIWPR